MSGEHARLAPSSAARWVQCPASVTLSERFPETEEKPEAEEGTAAHWACSEMLAGNLIAVGQVAPNGITLTDEMIEGAEMYLEAINGSL